MKRDKESLRIIFLGTPEFAVESLQRLCEGGYNVVAVITMPDKIAGRGHRLFQSPVKQFAVEHSIPVLQPTNLKDPQFVEELRDYKADLQIVIAFRMLPEVVWNMPPLGTFNLHASLLPDYRGAAPINWAVINGDTQTGVTTFFLKQEIDTGDVIQQEKILISDTDNVGIVHDKLMDLGAKMVIETVDAIIDDSVKPIPQSEITHIDNPRPAPKIFKETCKVDWDKSIQSIHNLVRGLSPYPAAWSTFVNDKGEEVAFKIFETSIPQNQFSTHKGNGELLSHDGLLYIKCDDGVIEIRSLQLAGKKRITGEEFLRGYKLTKE